MVLDHVFIQVVHQVEFDSDIFHSIKYILCYRSTTTWYYGVVFVMVWWIIKLFKLTYFDCFYVCLYLTLYGPLFHSSIFICIFLLFWLYFSLTNVWIHIYIYDFFYGWKNLSIELNKIFFIRRFSVKFNHWSTVCYAQILYDYDNLIQILLRNNI
jgi:hypothetical protein